MALLKIAAVLVVILLVIIAAFIVWFAFQVRPRRKREPGFEYVYVESDGSARELDADEREYLNTKFDPTDGARPYIKTKYESRDGWGKLSGYLRRRQLPKGIPVRPAPDEPASSK
ncbi:MAG: hypothetical protein M3362_21885 [Acidobacteriota bacterium]|nr:hypothetical protein [Acidobacteriota bacterium]